MNRLDEIVYYKPLSKEEIGGVVDLLLARLKLADTVRAVLANGLGLLGVSAPEKM